MDKKKSILNVCVSVGFKLVTMVMAIIVRRILIQTCGNEINGLNSLYLSIVGFLAVAELGVGSAITFCMYKPIVRGETDRVAALYHLFRRLYLLVGGVILTAGLAITPFIRYFAKDYAQLDVNFYSTFILMLLSTVVTYLFGAKTALINAYKNNYITTAITSGGHVLQNVLQILVLQVTHSFEWYLVCRIVSALAQWSVTELIVRKKYAALLRNKQRLDVEARRDVTRNVKAMFMHKIGALLVNTVDSIVISAFVGVVALGEYSNYTTILSSMTSVITLIFSSLTSIWGHLYAQADKKTVKNYFEAFHLLNFVVGVVFYLGYYAVIDDLIAILFALELVVEKSVSVVIAMNGFVQFMRQSALVFRDATGAFYNDRWKPLAEGITNIILSVLLVNRVGVTGVILATIVTNLVICHITEPYVLYKNSFSSSPVSYYFLNYGMIVVFVAAMLLLNNCLQGFNSYWKSLLVNGSISVGISILVCALVLLVNKKTCGKLLRLLKEKRK